MQLAQYSERQNNRTVQRKAEILVTQGFLNYIYHADFLPNNQDSTAYKELKGTLLRQNYFEK